MKSEKTYLIIIDDDPIFKEKMSLIVQHQKKIEIVLETDKEPELIEYLNSKENKIPNIALIGINSKNIDGTELTKLFRNNYPTIKTIATSNKLEDTLTSNIYLFDADSYLTKNDSKDEILRTIKKVSEKGFYYKEDFIKFIRDNHTKYKLINLKDNGTPLFTKRELEILDLICRQKTTQEISKHLFLSPRTVEGHRNSMMLKTGSKNVAGLIVYVFQNNLITMTSNSNRD